MCMQVRTLLGHAHMHAYTPCACRRTHVHTHHARTHARKHTITQAHTNTSTHARTHPHIRTHNLKHKDGTIDISHLVSWYYWLFRLGWLVTLASHTTLPHARILARTSACPHHTCIVVSHHATSCHVCCGAMPCYTVACM